MTPWTVAHQAPLSMEFSSQEYWSGLPCPPPGDLPHAGIEPASLMSPALAGRFFTPNVTWEAQRAPQLTLFVCLFWLLCEACGILVSQPGLEPRPLQGKLRVLTTGQPENSLQLTLKRSSRILWYFILKGRLRLCSHFHS